MNNPSPNPLATEALLFNEAPSDQAIYFEVQHGGHNLTRHTIVAFAFVGQGWVGYIGNMGWEGHQRYTKVVMKAMIGFRISYA